MYCRTCDQEFPDGASFCPNCGERLITREEPSPDADVEDSLQSDAESEAYSDVPAESALEGEEGTDSLADEGSCLPTNSEDAPADADSQLADADGQPTDDGGETADAESHIPPVSANTSLADTDPASQAAKAEDPGIVRIKRSHLIAAAIAAVALVAAIGAIWLAQGLLQPEDVVLDLESVEDTAFKDYLAEHVDANDSGAISQDEADEVVAIGDADEDAVEGNGLSGAGVESLAGIDVFQNLEVLVCPDNALESLDVSNNPKLTTVICDGNAIADIVLPAEGNIVVLHATSNNLASIDLSQQDELTDLRVDDGVEIVGKDAPEDSEVRLKIEDLALAYASAAESILLTSPDPQAELPMTAGNPVVDSRLPWPFVQPTMVESRELITSNAYGIDGISENWELDTTMSTLSLESGKQILRSVYGSCPDDLSYMNMENTDGFFMGDRWEYNLLAQNIMTDIATGNWKAYGKLVEFDAIVSYEFPGRSTAVKLHVTVVQDDESMFGYHLASVEFLGINPDWVDQANDADAFADEEESNVDEEVIDSIVEWGNSASGRHYGSTNSSQERSWPDFQSLVGTTWTGQLTETEHNSVMGQAACYWGRTQPFTITFRSVDENLGTAVVDMRIPIHMHGDLQNDANQVDGDKCAEVTGVQITLKKNSNATYQVYEGEDLTSYTVKLCMNEDGEFIAEVYNEAKVTQPFVSWRRDTYQMVRQ